jgi:DNA-binding SARP family transcriptional activator/tetratricopeptide (TPR) repeat protein
VHDVVVDVLLLGPFAVRVDGLEVPERAYGGRLTRRLVRLLACAPGRTASRDGLIDALWGADAPADPDANLNVLVNRARKVLPGAVEKAGRGYRLGPSVAVDAERFEDLVTAGDGEAALELWRGDPLPDDAYETWAQPVRDRLVRLHQDALELAAVAALASGSVRHAADLAARAVALAPLREAAHLLLVRALAASGDQAAALAAYGRLRTALAEELGVDPSHEAAAVHERLLRGSAEPAVESGAGAFVGRDRELTALCRLDPLAVVAGRSGSGKSRLLAEVTTRLREPFVCARAVLPERDAPWSLARALLTGADLDGLPQRARVALTALVDDDEPEGVDPQSWRALVLQGAAPLLAGHVVVVDDLQWADASSLDLLRLVIDRGSARAVLFAYRPEEVLRTSPVAALLADTAERASAVTLDPLDSRAVRRLVQPDEVADVLAAETDGTPFAVLAAVRELGAVAAADRWLVGGGDLVARARTAARAGQRRAVLARAERSSAAAQELLALLALLGRPTPAALLAAATGRPVAAVLSALVDLSGAGLVRGDPQGFAPAHDVVAEAVRDQLDEASRARLHALLAPAVTRADERARHLAGSGDVAAACAVFAHAADERLRAFAHDEAARLADEGLALGPEAPARLALLEVRAETHVRRGQPALAREDLRSAVVLAPAGVARSRLLARQSRLASGADDMKRASALAELALAEAGTDPAARADGLCAAALVDMNSDRSSRAEQRFAEALQLFGQLGNSRGVADVLDGVAMRQFLDGDVTGGVVAFDRVAALALDVGDLLRAVVPRSTGGHALVFAGRAQEGLHRTEEALDLARSLGYADGEAFALWHRSEALTAVGRLDEALHEAGAARAIAERLGHRGWTATAVRAKGIALRAGGDLAHAEDAFRTSLALSGEVRLFASWAHAQLSLVLTDRGALDEAVTQAAAALAEGPALAHFEARLAACRLAARGHAVPGAPDLAAALATAARSGHRSSAAELALL